jgi:hypothetical protein
VQKPAVTRNEMIGLLRSELVREAKGEVSICEVAARRNIFCHGFNRFGNGELRRRFRWLHDKNPAAPREEIEDLANRWQLARQEVTGLRTACDVQQREHDSCNGWDDFTTGELAKFYFEMTGKEIAV